MALPCTSLILQQTAIHATAEVQKVVAAAEAAAPKSFPLKLSLASN
jgi:hypothetical protein